MPPAECPLYASPTTGHFTASIGLVGHEHGIWSMWLQPPMCVCVATGGA